MWYKNLNNLSNNRVQVYLGLGSNLNNPIENIFSAFKKIKTSLLINAEMSSLYKTEPQDVKDQPYFYNAACRGLYQGSAFNLLKEILKIEKQLGRNRKKEQRRGPRSIDIDILLFGESIIIKGKETDREGRWLIIPHERLCIRRFALEPLLELEPNLKDPVTGKYYSIFKESIKGQGILKISSKEIF